MAADGYTLTAVDDVPLTGNTANILGQQPGVTLPGNAQQLYVILIFMTREGVDVSIGITVGGSSVLTSPSPVNINTTVGSLPSYQDDRICQVVAQGGDDIVISAANVNAAAQEARALVIVQPIDAATLIAASQQAR